MLPYRISDGIHRTLDIYASTDVIRRIYSWVDKSFSKKEIFPVYCMYFVQVRFSDEEKIAGFKKGLSEKFAPTA